MDNLESDRGPIGRHNMETPKSRVKERSVYAPGHPYYCIFLKRHKMGRVRSNVEGPDRLVGALPGTPKSSPGHGLTEPAGYSFIIMWLRCRTQRETPGEAVDCISSRSTSDQCSSSEKPMRCRDFPFGGVSRLSDEAGRSAGSQTPQVAAGGRRQNYSYPPV